MPLKPTCARVSEGLNTDMIGLLGMAAVVMVVVALEAGVCRILTTAEWRAGPRYPNSDLYSSISSGGFLVAFRTGGTHFCHRQKTQSRKLYRYPRNHWHLQRRTFSEQCKFWCIKSSEHLTFCVFLHPANENKVWLQVRNGLPHLQKCLPKMPVYNDQQKCGQHYWPESPLAHIAVSLPQLSRKAGQMLWPPETRWWHNFLCL